jgi:hypothetical protein
VHATDTAQANPLPGSSAAPMNPVQRPKTRLQNGIIKEKKRYTRMVLLNMVVFLQLENQLVQMKL